MSSVEGQICLRKCKIGFPNYMEAQTNEEIVFLLNQLIKENTPPAWLSPYTTYQGCIRKECQNRFDCSDFDEYLNIYREENLVYVYLEDGKLKKIEDPNHPKVKEIDEAILKEWEKKDFTGKMWEIIGSIEINYEDVKDIISPSEYKQYERKIKKQNP